ncbi:hypothetical protein OSB04_028144 [Centaurea solstitialis]|uniref:Integrase catalytic domain-containing protein n=1 Tax=Centaurea solstitialis TaxID=347529 RepID=A0AA38SMK0_9ASTR|nr:hypothetical protein OSB04_028144 [Centaurea solstitialis]
MQQIQMSGSPTGSVHIKEKCYKLHGYPIGYRYKSRVNNVVIDDARKASESNREDLDDVIKGLSSAQCQQLLAALSNQVVAQTVGENVEGLNKECAGTCFLFHIMLIAWILDSGASRHICHDLDRFIDRRRVMDFKVTLPNNLMVPVYMVGDVIIHNNILQKDVLYEKESKGIIGSADHCHGLYVNQVFSAAVSLDMWHKRFGHPTNKRLLAIKSLLDVKTCFGNNDCNICPMSNKENFLFMCSRIHCDIWGPFHVPGHHGHGFFITLVDDHSRFTWLYLIKHKSEAVKIKGIRSDNAHELNLTEFFADKGILHQKSCVSRPQQNSMVERTHQHLLNVALSLMFQSQIRLHFWSECVMTATFLINCTPSEVLKSKTPFEKLRGKVPDFSIFRTFGCLAFASTLSSQRHKFSPRAKACLFVRYPVGMKAYRLLDLETKQFFALEMWFFTRMIFLIKMVKLMQIMTLFPHRFAYCSIRT